MFYLKTEHDGKPIQVDIYDDEIYTRCSNCGKEFQVDTELLRQVLSDGGDFASTSLSCCDAERPELVRVK
ncbi:hypothetical protein GCM10025857_15400 [Alicyclobacillus contaminans]|uniref:hypothetical protein n=1 Tax=Alicyclobacillus contaminans TaxID=392016 RepID=UPI00047A7758|nr:hypothetical protein [Alicyclobacillus contaminans]GMA50183.1 hypothetical protein GCM10025857_15400 [Alicyclobacillus contaminans]